MTYSFTRHRGKHLLLQWTEPSCHRGLFCSCAGAFLPRHPPELCQICEVHRHSDRKRLHQAIRGRHSPFDWVLISRPVIRTDGLP